MSEGADGKVVLVTGSSSGIGRLTAETLARNGHIVYGSVRDSAGRNAGAAHSLRQAAQSEGWKLRVLDLDVTSSASVGQAVEALVREAGRIDVLVNNAGVMSIGVAEAFTEEQALHQMDVNFMGVARANRAVLPYMRKQNAGLLVHVSSIAGRVLFPGTGFYCASKFAVEALAEIYRYELSGFGVDSVIVQPGPFATHLLKNSPGPSDDDRLAEYGGTAKIRDSFIESFTTLFESEQAPDPQEVADAIAELVDLPAGERPLRTVCGQDYGARTINDQTEPIQAGVLEALGMAHMATIRGSAGET